MADDKGRYNPNRFSLARQAALAFVLLTLAVCPLLLISPKRAPLPRALGAPPAVRSITNLYQADDVTAGASGASLPFNPVFYGAKGDGVTDDSVAFQTCFNAAIAANGAVEVPQPRVQYLFTNGLVLRPQGGATQARLRVKARGNFNNWLYKGASNTSFIVFQGMKDCSFEGVKISFDATVSNTVCWDGRPTATFSSMGMDRWTDCRVTFAGTGGLNVGWRMGQGGGFSDQSDFHWQNCLVSGEGKQYGSIGWQHGGSQNMPNTYIGCAGSSLGCLLMADGIANLTSGTTNVGDTTVNVNDTGLFPASGTVQINTEQITYTGKTATSFTGCVRGANGTTAATYTGAGFVVLRYLTDTPQGAPAMGVLPGGQAITWVGGGGSANNADFHFGAGVGTAIVSGHRGELGGHFVEVGWGVSSTSCNVTCQACELSSYGQNADGISFLFKNNATFKFSGGYLVAAAQQGAACVTENGGTNGQISFENCSICATSPFYTTLHSWPVYIVGVQQLPNGGNAPTGVFGTQAPVSANISTPTAVSGLMTFTTSPVVATGSTTVNAWQRQDSLGNVWDESYSYNGNAFWNFRYKNATRTVADCVTNGTTTITSATAAFVSTDVNVQLSGTNIPASTWISSVTNGTTAVMNNAATGSSTGSLTLGGVQETPFQLLRNAPNDCRMQLNGTLVARMLGAGLIMGNTGGSTTVTNLTPGKQTLTFTGGGAAVASTPSSGGYMQLTVTDGVAFTISNPTGAQSGQEITYEILNSSGGAMGVITWGAQFKMDGSWANPGSTQRRTITFTWNGANWVQRGPPSGNITRLFLPAASPLEAPHYSLAA